MYATRKIAHTLLALDSIWNLSARKDVDGELGIGFIGPRCETFSGSAVSKGNRTGSLGWQVDVVPGTDCLYYRITRVTILENTHPISVGRVSKLVFSRTVRV